LQIFLFKNILTIEEHALAAAIEALHHHNIDLELLFKSKHNAEVSKDTKFVKFAFDQINVIAKTIIDGVKIDKNLWNKKWKPIRPT